MAYLEDHHYIDLILNQNDTGAYASLISKHSTMAFNIAMRITKSREDAEEVAQDAFVKVYKSLETFKGSSKFTTWLFRIVYNLALTKIRKKSLFTGSVDDDHFIESADENTFDAVAQLQSKERKKHLNAAISKLDETDQLLITLYYHQDLSVDEISEITDVSQANVKVRLYRSRKKIEMALNDQLKNELQSIL